MDSSLPEGIIQPTKEDTSIACDHLKPGFGASRARNHNHASRHGNTMKMLQRKVECGSEDIDVALHGPSFNFVSQEQAMHSCPELGCRDDHPWRSAPGSRSSRNSPHQHSPLSQPATPTGLLHRLENRFRRAQPWESPFGSSRSISSTSLIESADGSIYQAGKERRRRARDSEVNHGNSSAEDSVPVISAPVAEGEEGTRQLATAGIALGTLDLDRLSFMARNDETRGKTEEA